MGSISRGLMGLLLIFATLPSCASPLKVGSSRTGKASWYGADHHGQKTASGEIFDMKEMTAAHRTLPMDSKVRVTNLSNGKSVVVRINDRGPFSKGRLIDVSESAARELGMLKKGVVNVRIEVLELGH
ncbi:MAG: septal ring lytic transglycosylase RlpA family protein [Bdellovibrio sp.]|nr:septal ring lytic transglycosylase RlpA family protein [Bdellovibrio sp.]